MIAGPTFKALLSSGKTVLSGWMAIPSPLVADILARAGWSSIVIDMQHGLVGYDDMVACVAAISRAGCAAIVRVPVRDDGLIGRAMDAGAEGVICPMINSGQEASWLTRNTKYPPMGQRSWAPTQALNLLGMDKDQYLASANDLIVTMAMVETQTALKNIDSIASTPGVDMIFVGPNDLSVSLSDGARVDPNDYAVDKALDLILRKCEAHSVFAGIFANNVEMGRKYRDMGFRFISVGSDMNYLEAGSHAALTGVNS